jgi:tripartite ATP-independent transporter DctP family solute receptor
MSKRKYALLISIIVGICCIGTQSLHAEQTTLKLGFVTAASETDPYYITSKKFAELIESYSDNAYQVDIFPSGQLGNERDMIKNLTMGSMDLGVITNAPVGSYINAFLVLDLPFIFSNREVGHEVLDGEAGKMRLGKLDKLNIKGLAFSEGGYRHMINNVRPILAPEDTEGIKFRVMKTPIYIGMFKALGSNAVPLPWGEVFTAVQQNVVDGLEIPIPVIYSNKFYEVTKYLSLTGHTYSPLIIMCSKNRWNQFSPEDQAMFSRAAQEAAEFERDELKGIIESFIEKLENEGMEINDVPNKTPFQTSVKSMYKDFEDKIGPDVMKTVLEARDQATQ